MSSSAEGIEAIELPKGGGALRGIGESFSADLHTGTGNLSVPLAIPAGRGGFQPSLALRYSTGAPNGAFGLGWALDVPAISHKTSKGVPRYDDAGIFTLPGAEDLVPVEQSAGRTRYRPRVEGLFGRIERRVLGADSYWEVRTRDGNVSRYGARGPAAPAFAADAVVRDGRRILSWHLAETLDPFGNRLEYAYVADAPAGGAQRARDRANGRTWRHVLLDQVRYVDYADGGQTRFLVTVDLEYEDRPDPFSDYRGGFEVRHARRCRRIVVRTHADPARPQPVRTYELSYLDDEADAQPNGASLLRRIQPLGHEDNTPARIGPAVPELAPLEFSYTGFDPRGRRFEAVRGPAPPRSLASPDHELVDLTGDGLPDMLELNGAARYWRNLGGRFDEPRELSLAPAGARLADSGVQVIDADGDGRPDLVSESAGGYFPLNSDVRWDAAGLRRYRVMPSLGFEDQETRPLDLDGDGITDLLRTGTSLECRFNSASPAEAWTRVRLLERADGFRDLSFSDPHVHVADLSGDGLRDIVRISGRVVEYWPNRGHGDWGAKITMATARGFPAEHDPRRVLFGDLDGDGLDDLVYLDASSTTIWINRGGDGWSEPFVLEGTPLATDATSVRLVDLEGRGIAGVLWSSDSPSVPDASLYFLAPAGDEKPYLLTEMDNHSGSVTRVSYRSSTEDYLRDLRSRATRWRTTLPFPVQVVGRVDTVDAISDVTLTTEYRYHHGYWDGVEREFRGFGRVDTRDTESGGRSPPLETRSWFHLGPVQRDDGSFGELDLRGEYFASDPVWFPRPARTAAYLSGLGGAARRDALRAFSGLMLRSELYALDGTARAARPYTVSATTYGLARVAEDGLVDDPAAVAGVASVHLPQERIHRITQWERGDDPLTAIRFSEAYDGFGRARDRIELALPRRAARRVTIEAAVVGQVKPDETRILASLTRGFYATPDAGLYIHDRVVHTAGFEHVDPGGVSEHVAGDLAAVLADQAAAALALRDRMLGALGAWRVGEPVPAGLRLLSHTRNAYDGAPFAGRTDGRVGPAGALTASESLVFTDAELDAAFGDRRPAYLGGSAALPAGAPAGFPAATGLRQAAAVVGTSCAGWYARTVARARDGRGSVTAFLDRRGNRTDLKLDRFSLLRVGLTDAAGLETEITPDYRVLGPRRAVDPNGNATVYAYTPAGLLHKTWIEARDGQGGSEAEPETRFDYDMLAYSRTRGSAAPQPIWVHTTRRVRHASDGAASGDGVLELREYTDGFGRLVQKRARAEPVAIADLGLPVVMDQAPASASATSDPDRVVVSGWQRYDDKGRVVALYEPFFSTGWDYSPAERGRALVTVYDARGRIAATVRPDGAETREVFGLPADLMTPDVFEPTPWETYAYDANDLDGLRTGPSPSPTTRHAPAAHRFTPVSRVFDALGRALAQVERCGDRPEADWFLSRSAYDVRGNVTAVTDPLGRRAFAYAYDLGDRVLRTTGLDDGIRTFVLDALGNPIETRGAGGAVALRAYDVLNRLTRVWARETGGAALTLRERIEYGDDGDRAQPVARRRANRDLGRLGRVATHHDEAGVVEYRAYDFKGNATEKARTTISDAALAAGWSPDWSAPGADAALEADAHVVSARFDALNRAVEVTLPLEARPRAGGGPRRRAVLRSRFNRAGALEALDLDDQPYVSTIAYDAYGRPVLTLYGNGLMTRRAYDEWTQRVARIRTERVVHAPGSLTWAGTGSPFQDVGHAYDPTGNVLQLDDRTPGCGVRGGALGADRLRRTFRYDPLYRLLSGTGRACSGPARPLIAGLACGVFDQPFAPGAPAPTQANAPDLTEEYREAYAYDPAGNLLEIAYRTGSRLRWRRRFAIGNRNRVASLNSGGATQALAYDARGNLRRQGVDRRFGWDHADRLTSFTVQAGAAPTFEARYLHGADGTRVKRWIRRNGGATESTVYVEGAFEEDRWSQGGVGRRANRVHVLDDATRVAVVQLGDRDDRDAGPPVQYHHGDHLRSSTLVVDAVGGWVNREEFTPYGETSFGSFGRKRYRYAGREREDESGLTRHGSRHYAGFLGRWISPDPLGAAAGLNPYRYVRGNPMTYDDRSGLQEDEAEGAEPAGQPKTLEDVQNEKLGPLMNFFGLNKAARLEQEWTDEDPSKLYEAREVRAKGVTAAGEAGVATGEAAMLAHPAPEAEVDALSATIGRKVGSAIDRVKGAVQDTGAAIGRAVSAAGEAAGKVGEYFRSVGPELRKVAGEMSHTLGSGTAWIEDVGRVLLKSPEVASESRLIRAGAQPLDDLAKMRGQLHLPPPGPGSPTLARLDIGGKSFYGISGVKDIDLVVNPISRTHAEADVFQQAANAGVTAETATLYVDYPNGLCLACAGNGGVDTLARQLGLREVQVVGPNFSYPYRVAPGP